MKSLDPPISNPNGILLVDLHSHSRDARAEMMRKLGATVDCVSGPTSAITRFQSGVYRLVLIDLGEDHEGAEQLALDIRRIRPKQLIGFLIGSPTYISKTLPRKSEISVSLPATNITKSTPEPEISHESAFGRKIREMEQSSRNEE